MNKIKEWLYIAIFTMLLIVCNLHSIGVLWKNNVGISNILVIIILLIFLLSLILFKNSPITSSYLLSSILWGIFGVSISLSLFYNEDLTIYHVIIFNLLIPAIMLIKISEKFIKINLLSIILSIIPIIYFINFGNTLGMLYALLGIVVFIYINKYYEAKLSLIVTSCTVLFVIIYITESRTSLISYIFAILFYYVIQFISSNKTISKKKILILFSLIFIMLMVFWNKIEKLIFNKYANSSSDMFSNRTQFWKGAIDSGISFFGKGQDFFLINFSIGNSHNTFIELLTVYGLLPLLIFCLIILYGGYRCIKSANSVLMVPFGVFYIAMSMAESLLFIDSRLIIFIFCLILIYKSIFVLEKNLLKSKVF